MLLCNLVAGGKGGTGRAFFSLRDLSDNNAALEWDGMVSNKHRLEFEVNRRCIVSLPRVEYELAGELKRREADVREAGLPRSDGWDSFGGEETVGSK